MAGMGMEMEGLEQLYRDLDKIGHAGDKAQDKALKAGGKIFYNLAISRVNYSKVHKASHLRDAIKVSPVKTDDDGEKYVSVGSYLGGGRYRNNVYWGHIVEGGHVLKSRSGKVIGYVAAKPFMQPAYEQGLNPAAKAMADIIFKEMGL